jgi:hypothetical protein
MAVMVSTDPKVRYLSRSLCRAPRPSSRVPQSRTGVVALALLLLWRRPQHDHLLSPRELWQRVRFAMRILVVAVWVCCQCRHIRG